MNHILQKVRKTVLLIFRIDILILKSFAWAVKNYTCLFLEVVTPSDSVKVSSAAVLNPAVVNLPGSACFAPALPIDKRPVKVSHKKRKLQDKENDESIQDVQKSKQN